MRPAVRKCALIAHVTSSVGWLGAVLAFLALAVAGLISEDATLVRSAYVAMAFIGWYVIVPVSLAALLTGVVQSAGTEWGLFRHYWTVVKMLLTIGATALLPMHLRVADRLAAVARQGTLSFGDLPGLRVQIAGDAVAAIMVLLMTTTVSVYKPWGKIEFAGTRINRRPSLGPYVLITCAVLLGLALILHFTGVRMRLH